MRYKNKITISFVFITILLFSLNCYALTLKEIKNNFNSNTTKEQVKKIQNGELRFESNNTLNYIDNYYGNQSTIIYSFINDRLKDISIDINITTNDPIEAADIYAELVGKYKKVLGKTVEGNNSMTDGFNWASEKMKVHISNKVGVGQYNFLLNHSFISKNTQKSIKNNKANKFNFRSVNWGMSKNEVKEKETAKLMGDIGDSLFYKTNVAGFSCVLGYSFANDKLVRGAYIIEEKHSNYNLYIQDYNKLKELLTKKYDTPIEDSHKWFNDLYKDDPEEYGMAVAVGHLRYAADWNINNTLIQLRLYGDNYKINLMVAYDSKELSEERVKAKEKNDISDL